jgi:hypothetical protein
MAYAEGDAGLPLSAWYLDGIVRILFLYQLM